MAMDLDESPLDKLRQEAADARIKKTILVATGEDLLDRIRAISETSEQWVYRATGQEEQGPIAHP
jgi:hypothetical protein